MAYIASKAIFQIILIILVLVSSPVKSEQLYIQYLDAESGVIKRPEGSGWSDPFGDGVWRSSWVYASLLQLEASEPEIYKSLVQKHKLSHADCAKFLKYLYENCLGDKEWKLPKNPSQKFSRDQLIPLLYLLAVVNVHHPDLIDISGQIMEKLIILVKREGAVSDSTQGQISPNIKYVIDVLARKYGKEYLNGNQRGLYKTTFSGQLKSDSLLVQIPHYDMATLDSYSVFNRLSLVTLQALVWGVGDKDVQMWRSNYKQHADKGWGPSFKIVAGRNISEEEILKYEKAMINRAEDNDIIMSQRPEKYLKNIFPLKQFSEKGSDTYLVLDYLILKALYSVWR